MSRNGSARGKQEARQADGWPALHGRAGVVPEARPRRPRPWPACIHVRTHASRLRTQAADHASISPGLSPRPGGHGVFRPPQGGRMTWLKPATAAGPGALAARHESRYAGRASLGASPSPACGSQAPPRRSRHDPSPFLRIRRPRHGAGRPRVAGRPTGTPPLVPGLRRPDRPHRLLVGAGRASTSGLVTVAASLAAHAGPRPVVVARCEPLAMGLAYSGTRGAIPATRPHAMAARRRRPSGRVPWHRAGRHAGARRVCQAQEAAPSAGARMNTEPLGRTVAATP